jgi:FkbM family methyltransferase
MLSLSALATIYRPYLDESTGWWPVEFHLKLHDAAKVVYGTVINSTSKKFKKIDVIDLGSNIGVHTIGMSKFMPERVHVTSVEANPYMVERLRGHTEITQSKNITILSLAITPYSKAEVSFRISRKYIELGSVDPKYFETFFSDYTHDAELEDVRVQASTLDKLIQEYSLVPRFIKFDLEGVDDQVLLTSQSVFRYRTRIMFETKNSLDLWQLFEHHEYRIFDCFMNELYLDTFCSSEVCPIDRFAFPKEAPEINEVANLVRLFWSR